MVLWRHKSCHVPETAAIHVLYYVNSDRGDAAAVSRGGDGLLADVCRPREPPALAVLHEHSSRRASRPGFCAMC